MSSVPNLIYRINVNLNHNTGVFFYINCPAGSKIYMEMQRPNNSQNNIAKMSRSVVYKTEIDSQTQRMKCLWLRGWGKGGMKG